MVNGKWQMAKGKCVEEDLFKKSPSLLLLFTLLLLPLKY
jgi:hypothetical protein